MTHLESTIRDVKRFFPSSQKNAKHRVLAKLYAEESKEEIEKKNQKKFHKKGYYGKTIKHYHSPHDTLPRVAPLVIKSNIFTRSLAQAVRDAYKKYQSSGEILSKNERHFNTQDREIAEILKRQEKEYALNGYYSNTRGGHNIGSKPTKASAFEEYSHARAIGRTPTVIHYKRNPETMQMVENESNIDE